MPKNMLHLLPKLGPEGIARLGRYLGFNVREVPLLPLEMVKNKIRGTAWERYAFSERGCPCEKCQLVYKISKIILEG